MLSENSEHGLQLGCSQRELQGLVWGGRLVSMKRGKAGKGQGPGRTPSPRSGFPQCEAKVRDWAHAFRGSSILRGLVLAGGGG